MKSMKSIIRAAALGLVAIVGSGCGPDRQHAEYKEFYSHPVEQVFRDHDGYRLYSTDEKGFVKEKKYRDCYGAVAVAFGAIEGMPEAVTSKFKEGAGAGCVTIVKDLEDTEKGFANVLVVKHVNQLYEDRYYDYVQIHLPKSQGLSPGGDAYRVGKSGYKHVEMNEIK